VRGDVDRVAEGGEVTRHASRDHADERDARVDAGAERQPGSALIAVAGLEQEITRRLNGGGRMIGPGQQR
jgi:hypothetical protein